MSPRVYQAAWDDQDGATTLWRADDELLGILGRDSSTAVMVRLGVDGEPLDIVSTRGGGSADIERLDRAIQALSRVRAGLQAIQTAS